VTANATHPAVMDHGELAAEFVNELYDRKPQSYAKDNTAAFNCMQ